jgi:hypothetical protein
MAYIVTLDLRLEMVGGAGIEPAVLESYCFTGNMYSL